MNVQEQLAVYRQKFGLDTQQAKQESETSSLFAPQSTSEQPQATELFQPAGQYATRPEGTTERMAASAKTFSEDKIMSAGSQELESIIMNLRSTVEDPTHPMDMDSAKRILEKVLSKIDIEELGGV